MGVGLRDRAATEPRAPRWRGVLHGALAVFGLLHVVAAIALWDLEAAGMTALLAVVVGLRRRLPRVGDAALAALFVNMAAWSLPGLVRNLAGAAPVWVVLLQAGLVLSALLGLIALVAQRRRVARAALPAVGTALALFLGVGVVALGGEASRGGQPGDLEVVTADTAFMPERLEATAGEVSVHLANEDFFWHTFSIPELGVALWVPMEGTGRVSFDVPAGTWAFTCEVPGHEAVMSGELVVTP